MIEREGLDRLRRNFHTGDIPLSTGECLDSEIVAALAEGSLDADARARALHHVAQCALCRRAVASVAEALVDGPITHEIEIAEGRHGWRRKVLRITVPLAAAAVLLLLLRSPAAENGGEHRGAAESRSQAPVPVSPVGPVAAVHVLLWTRVANADAYRVTLFDAEGRVAYEARATDTTAALPDSIVLVAGRAYLWKVEARTGFDRWATSALVEFSIASKVP